MAALLPGRSASGSSSGSTRIRGCCSRTGGWTRPTSGSPLYNLWVDDQEANPGTDPEPMDVSAYDYGAVIGYNTARTPRLGSAIFLHINIGMPTAGCVTLPVGELLEILRWLNPAASPRIEMGVKAPELGAETAGG
jgi:L,D-peptidoglycan transpeptidase YkuD (ErfK/YbiS/YcfS/YnhG family)